MLTLWFYLKTYHKINKCHSQHEQNILISFIFIVSPSRFLFPQNFTIHVQTRTLEGLSEITAMIDSVAASNFIDHALRKT